MKTVAIKRIKYSPINNPHLPNERLCLLKHASMAKRRHPEMNNEYRSMKGRAKFDNKATLKSQGFMSVILFASNAKCAL